MRMGTGLYVKNSVKAVALYQRAFGLTLGYHVLNEDGSYFHSELYRDGVEMFSVIETGEDRAEDRIVQVSALLDSEAEVRAAYELLCEGGRVDIPIGPLPWSPCAASVTDRFGVWWYISAPQHHPAEDYDPTAPWTPDMYKKP